MAAMHPQLLESDTSLSFNPILTSVKIVKRIMTQRTLSSRSRPMSKICNYSLDLLNSADPWLEVAVDADALVEGAEDVAGAVVLEEDADHVDREECQILHRCSRTAQFLLLCANTANLRPLLLLQIVVILLARRRSLKQSLKRRQ